MLQSKFQSKKLHLNKKDVYIYIIIYTIIIRNHVTETFVN